MLKNVLQSGSITVTVEEAAAAVAQIYLLSDKDRIIAKNTLIGGFGTGKLPASILYCFYFIAKQF